MHHQNFECQPTLVLPVKKTYYDPKFNLSNNRLMILGKEKEN